MTIDPKHENVDIAQIKDYFCVDFTITDSLK